MPILKKLLWLITTSAGLVPNIDKMSRNIGASREITYRCLDYLDHAGLINNIKPKVQGMRIIRKPGKTLMNNTNLILVLNTTLKLPNLFGNIRETFFVNQTKKDHVLFLHPRADFFVDEFIFEIGGKHKSFKQLQGESLGYLAVDEVEIGFGKKFLCIYSVFFTSTVRFFKH